jgi:hypothetical protein
MVNYNENKQKQIISWFEGYLLVFVIIDFYNVGEPHTFFCHCRESHSGASEGQTDRGDEESAVVRDE